MHSLKDVPTALARGPRPCRRSRTRRSAGRPGVRRNRSRAPARGARVGTTSLRRRALLRHLRPDLEVHGPAGERGHPPAAPARGRLRGGGARPGRAHAAGPGRRGHGGARPRDASCPLPGRGRSPWRRARATPRVREAIASPAPRAHRARRGRGAGVPGRPGRRLQRAARGPGPGRSRGTAARGLSGRSRWQGVRPGRGCGRRAGGAGAPRGRSRSSEA